MKTLWIVLTLAPLAALYAQGNADNGKKLYVKNGCYQCHGLEGQGSNAGARLAQKSLTAPAFIAYVRKPAPGGMPVYSSKVISDADLTEIWTYVKSIPPPPPVTSIPLLGGQ
ncbi:MAG TPA: cytochrome c [Terriglobia bacterium]|nr:cytochrome c [Terriglobia bacterium]